MRIVHLVDYFQPKLGYQETFLAKEHANLGHEVYVVTSDRYYPFESYENSFYKLLGKRLVGSGVRNEEGIKIIRLKAWEIPGTPLIYLSDLKKTLNKIKPDVVYCHNMFSITSARIARLKQEIGYKLIYDTHTASFNTNLTDSFPKKIYNFFYQRLAIPKITKESDAIFAIGEEEQKFICRKFQIAKKSVPIIRLGVDTNIFRYSKEFRNLLRKQYDITTSDTVIIFSGKISKTKDIHILLEAVRKLDNQRIIVMLVGGGDKNYISDLNRKFEKLRIVWLPFVENKELFKYYSLADIAVWSGNPSISILEAMSSRLPVILPGWYGTMYLDESQGIRRFKRGDAKNLATELGDLVNNYDSRHFLGVNGQRFIQQKLTWQKIAKETLKLIA
jgi:glycosyltransferase involved in cell wall biosynthesis